MIKVLPKLMLLLAGCVPLLAVAAPDLAREARLAAQVEDVIFDGEVIWLQANHHEFLAIDTPAQGDSHGVVLMLHDRGLHPNWESVMYPLRIGLAAAGWRILAIQLPVLEKSAKYYDYLPLFGDANQRIDAALAYLAAEKEFRVVMLAHSCGVHMSMDWLSHQSQPSLAGYIGLGMGATDTGQPMRQPFPFDRLASIPMLDILGEQEYPGVLQRGESRRTLLQQSHAGAYTQRLLPEADHYFTNVNEPLVKAVADWLAAIE